MTLASARPKANKVLVHIRCFLDSEEASELYVDEVLDGSGRLLYLDRTVSMSALAEAEARALSANHIMDHFDRQGDPHGT